MSENECIELINEEYSIIVINRSDTVSMNDIVLKAINKLRDWSV